MYWLRKKHFDVSSLVFIPNIQCRSPFRTPVCPQKIITFKIKISDVRNKKNTGVRNDHRKKTDIRKNFDGFSEHLL